MKTPREILLHKHQAVGPKLDEVRRSVLNGAGNQAVEAARLSSALRFPQLVWNELILPCRRIWGGLAAAWILILLLNVASSDTDFSGPTMAQAAKRSPEVIRAAKEHRRLLSEMLADARTEPIAEPPRSILRPRSERQISFKLA
jgi:hypothetical protein